MKNQILAFFLGIFVMLSIAAGSIATDIVAIKPATPRLTSVTVHSTESTISQTIKTKMSEGYVILNTVYCHNTSATILVMVKY